MYQIKLRKKKDINEVNAFVRWGIIIGIVFFAAMTYFIWLIEFDILRNPKIVTDTHLKLGLILVAFLLALCLINKVICYLAKQHTKNYLERFDSILDKATFVEATEKVYFAGKKYDHVVLILHGFLASTQEFQFLIQYLKANNINYYVPNLLGFGIDDIGLLKQTRRYDWYRSCIGIFDALSQISNTVSIIGHSMGSLLAAYIAEQRSVRQLILTGPGFYSIAEDLKYKTFLTTPVIALLYIMIIPYLPKPIRKGRKTTSDTLDDTYTNKIFQYLAVPVNSVREIFYMQNEVHPELAQCDQLSIIYGAHELTVDVDKLFKHLDKYNKNYAAYCLANSAHNVLEDFDYKECCQLIIDILQDRKQCKNI